jgi:hypothetical protein
MDEATLIGILAGTRHEPDISDEEIERRFRDTDVVVGKWLDSTKPHGFDYEVLKGGELLQKSNAGGLTTISLIPMFCSPD